ncbi:RNA-binding protein RRM domain [Pyrenophora tritici-repentis]|nr:RNA binding protein [Pyrenophora tritici-repentis]KAF7444516.1 RNA binding protein [Pyrenophora tritici-repentis]KAG9378756.1 RNA binding protein [Pyrenophora tritici-repentis]KAI1547714.1 RNA-binding protein RRM domain [Pyrenophora tritici-repentis]KAI1557787.1 RNA-binding protein RRM domain [Pyrenophora tritici-repentis]
MKTSENFINVNDDEPMPDATEDAPVKDKKKSKKDKDSKKSKKSKKATEAEDTAMEDVEDTPAETNGVDVDSKAAKKEKKKDKKEKKEKKTKKTKESESNGDVLTEDTAAEAEMGEEVEVEGEEAQAAVEANQGRFIVFVGNLPYSATKEEIEKHFEKIKPSEIRLRTYKGTEKFMGTCFVEFDRYDRMVTCLKKYHHSVFPDPKKKEGRKINVELSAGGGGNSETRKTKIAAKNEKLHDERARDRIKEAEVSMKQRERKEKKEAKSGKKADKKEEEPAAEKPSEAETFGMNPARLAMMQGPAVPHRSRY